MVRRILLRGSFPRCELSDRPLGVTHHPHWFHPTAPFFDLPQLPSPHVLPLRLTAGGCPMLHCGAHMGVAAPVKQAAVNTPCTVQPPSLPSHPLPRLTRAHGRRARRTTVARRRRRPHPTANAAVRSHSPPPHGYRASNPPSAHTGGSGVPPWHPVPLRATQRRIRVGARGGSCRYEATRRRPAPLSVAAASGWPTRRTPLHLPGFPLPCMAIALGHRTGRGRCPRHGHDRLTPTPLPRHVRHRGPHQWEGPAPPSALVPLPCTSCPLHPPPPPASPRPLLQVSAVAPLPARCRRVSSSYIPPPSPLPAPRPFHWSAPPATRTTPPPSPPHHPKRSLRSRWRTINTAITPGQMRRQNRRHV